MKSLLFAGFLLFGGLCGYTSPTIEQPSGGMIQEFEIFYMYENESGVYFLEPSAEYENVIFVDHESMHDWGFIDEIHHGTRFIGQFDSTGWELFGIKATK